MRRRLGDFLPSLRWQLFRLYAEPRTTTYLHIKLFQLVGWGKWSLSLGQCDTTDPQKE